VVPPPKTEKRDLISRALAAEIPNPGSVSRPAGREIIDFAPQWCCWGSFCNGVIVLSTFSILLVSRSNIELVGPPEPLPSHPKHVSSTTDRRPSCKTQSSLMQVSGLDGSHVGVCLNSCAWVLMKGLLPHFASASLPRASVHVVLLHET
jgi:hypothetical protein